MQLSTKDGISCDLCNLEAKLTFTYYSYDFESKNNTSRNKYSLDVCPKCHSDISNKVIKNYRPSRDKLFCDITGELIDGEYYYCSITKIDVDISKKTQPKIDKKHLELVISKEAYNGFRTKSDTNQKIQTTSNNWTTTNK